MIVLNIGAFLVVVGLAFVVGFAIGRRNKKRELNLWRIKT